MKTLDIDKDIIELLRIRRPTYFGHVSRMPAERFPLFGRTEGSRARGRHRKKWLDSVKEDCAAMNLTLVEATRVAEDRRFWRTSIRHLGCQRTRTPPSSQRH